jgi:DNA topoisomerase I
VKPPPPLRRRDGPASPIPLDPLSSSAEAWLRYVSDEMPGIRRQPSSRGFRYGMEDGTPVRDLATRRRARQLAVPPAWTDVWICARADGHIQATGRDSKGRKQYRYHPRWRAVRDATKYSRLRAFGLALPRIRTQVEEHLALPGLSRDKILATIVQLLETTCIRVGNAQYARKNGSYGLTTLRTRHVRIEGAHLRFAFRGKGGKRHEIDVTDARLARIVRRCRDIPGHELFQYMDETGTRQSVGSADVNAYLQALTGHEFTAKDFRTWAGTVLAAQGLAGAPPASGADAKRTISAIVRQVANRLGNTPAICQRCYIHPRVLDAYRDGSLRRALGRASRRTRGLDRDEVALLRLLSAGRGRPANAAVARERSGPSVAERSARRDVAGVASARRQSGTARRSPRQGDHSGNRCRVPA